MAKLKVLKSFEDIPKEIRNEIEENLAEDILQRYNNSTYHNEDIIHNTLAEYGYKLRDNYLD